MKVLLISVALGLAIPSLASATENLMSDCQIGQDECKTEFYKVTGTAIVALNCTDGSTVYDEVVSSPNIAITCTRYADKGPSHREYICDSTGQKITYDIKSHLKCK